MSPSPTGGAPKWAWLAVGVLACGMGGGFFLHSNPEFLSCSALRDQDVAASGGHGGPPSDSAGQGFRPIHDSAAATAVFEWIPLSGITVVSCGSPGVRICISVRIGAANADAAREILFKREDIRVIARKALDGLAISGYTVMNVRSRILKGIVRITEPGAAADVAVDSIRVDRE